MKLGPLSTPWPLLAAAIFGAGGCCQRPIPAVPDGKKNIPQAALERPEDQLPSFVSLFAKASPSVVNISAAHPLPFPEELLPRRERELLRAVVRSLGSGFVLDHQGHVVTCSSVVQDAQEIRVILANGKQLQARLVGSDEVSDIAVLAIPSDQAPPPLILGKSASLKVGDWVAAFGYPFGLSDTITAGIVSAVRTAEEMKASHGLILSDASINPGCNGGPLLDTTGKVVGINLIPGQTQGSMGFAIPIEDAIGLIDLLKTGRTPQHPWLGIFVQYMDARLAASFGLDEAEGALVSRVVKGGPADRAGVVKGDVIIAFAGRPVENPLKLIETVKDAALNKPVKLRIIRRGKRKTLTITPRAAPP